LTICFGQYESSIGYACFPLHDEQNPDVINTKFHVKDNVINVTEGAKVHQDQPRGRPTCKGEFVELKPFPSSVFLFTHSRRLRSTPAQHTYRRGLAQMMCLSGVSPN
jgi:hypothetical protein